EISTYGDQNTPAPITHDKGSSWKLWENLAKQDPDFGHPDVFCENLPERSWFVSATATLENKKIAPYFERLTKRSLYDGKVNTGGIITVVDSNWELSFTIQDRKSTRLNSSHVSISYAVFCLKKKKITEINKMKLTSTY